MHQAPEVLSGHGASLPADVYAFGIIMWEVIFFFFMTREPRVE